MRKRILVCAYFAKNVGDDLFLKVLFDRYPSIDWKLLTANRNYLKIFKDYKNVEITYSYRDAKLGKYQFNPFFIMNRILSNIKKYDAIVTIGGSIFMQGPAWQMKLKERDYLINQLKAKRNFIIGANFGPFHDQSFFNQYHKLLSTYDDICFRDSCSYEMFKGLDNVRLAPDVVLSISDQSSKKKEKSVGISTIQLEGRVDLSEYAQQYEQKIIAFIKRYIDEGYQVKLFSFCENEGDLQGIRDIENQLDVQYLNHVHVVNYTGDLTQFLNEFKRCERIIGTRFHALILAMKYKQPFYPLIYSAKTRNFLEDLGFEESGCTIKDIEHLNVEEIIDIKSFNNMRDEQVFLDAHQQFKKLDEFIGQRSEESGQKEDFICN